MPPAKRVTKAQGYVVLGLGLTVELLAHRLRWKVRRKKQEKDQLGHVAMITEQKDSKQGKAMTPDRFPEPKEVLHITVVDGKVTEVADELHFQGGTAEINDCCYEVKEMVISITRIA